MMTIQSKVDDTRNYCIPQSVIKNENISTVMVDFVCASHKWVKIS